MKTLQTNATSLGAQHGAWQVLCGGLFVTLLAVGWLGCGSGKDKGGSKAGDPEATEQAIRQEVDRRLAQERPRMEERIRTELARKLKGAAPGARHAEAMEPGEPGGKPAREPGDEPAARPDPGGEPASRPEPGERPDPAGAPEPREVSGPSALPPDAMEVKAPEEDPQGLVLNKVVLAKKLVERKPEETGTAFTLEDGRIYCHIDAKNPKGPERMLTVVWHHNGREFHRLKLRVGVGHVWRTWAYLTIRPPHVGNWRCGVLNEEGQLMRGVGFTISK